MIELFDPSPKVDVSPAEYHRLLGFPPGHAPSERAQELTEWARAWYSVHGNPWIYARHVESLAIANDSVSIAGESFVSSSLRLACYESAAENVFLVAVSAGPELEHHAQALWREQKPDEYFFLEVYGSAVVEHLITLCGARLCAWAEPRGLAVLPHLSPGYAGWDVAQQPRLLRLIRAHGSPRPLGKLDVLPSGMLRPKKSLLAVFGVTGHVDRVGRNADLNPCRRCSFVPCQYRRAPYRRPAQVSGISVSAKRSASRLSTKGSRASLPAALDHNARYAVPPKALARWMADRLTLTRRDDGSIDALFRYEGTTCTNLGRRLLFQYYVQLGRAEFGYPIQSQRCIPAPGDTGYMSMCEYGDTSDMLMATIEREAPLFGRPLNDVLTWDTPAAGAGCYCQPGDRLHKWRLVLETIHYALVEQEKCGSQFPPSANSVTAAR